MHLPSRLWGDTMSWAQLSITLITHPELALRAARNSSNRTELCRDSHHIGIQSTLVCLAQRSSQQKESDLSNAVQ